MEAKINVAAILKDKPQGTKLYSSACGKCELKEAEDKSFKVSFYSSKFGFMNDGEGIFDKNGKLYDDGECVVFPSKEMRNWSKFAWKKGDVLVGVGQRIIFEKFIDENYTRFQGKYSLSTCEDKTLIADKRCYTSDFRKLDDSCNVKNYFKELEEKLGGKLNRETLEVEKPQPEFKNGDIVVYGKSVAICRKIYKHTLCFYVSLNEMFGLLFDDEMESSEEYRFATEEEKQQLFDALEKEGKAWDAEKKAILDLKPKCEFKPFDKVLCRNSKDDTWEADFFARLTRKEIDYTQSDKYLCVGDLWMYCIPYNEETAHLLGTTDDWKGGEG
jgi:hypothetical protein